MLNKFNFIQFIPLFIIVFPTYLSAQEDTVKLNSAKTKLWFRQEVGIDLAATIPVIVRKSETMYLLNYKYHFKKHAIRSGINLLYQSDDGGQKSIDYRLGFEWDNVVKKWEFFYGIDVDYSYRKYNTQTNTIVKYGISPLIGFRYYFSNRFSMSTEPKLDFFYTVYRDPKSFSKEANTETLNIGLGSIGNVLVNFHF